MKTPDYLIIVTLALTVILLSGLITVLFWWGIFFGFK